MNINKLISTFTKLTFTVPSLTRSICTNDSLLFRSTPVLMGEPLKKKKRLDPAVIKGREERKKRKLEKSIRRLEKNAKKLKPIAECELPFDVLDKIQQHKRPALDHSYETLEKRALLEKRWCTYKTNQHLVDIQMLDRIQFAQQKVLDELRKESEELYQAAIQPDELLMPYKIEGPVETPPIANYDSPDGDYQDVSKKW